MASAVVRSVIRLRPPLLSNLHVYRAGCASCYSSQILSYNGSDRNFKSSQPIGSRALSTDIKWEGTNETKTEAILTGPLIPWSDLMFIQKIFCPYTYTVMYSLDFLTAHLPWWSSIVALTATIRVILLPLYIKQAIIFTKIHNIRPEVERLQVQMKEDILSDTPENGLKRQKELMSLFDKHGVGMIDRMKFILIQAPFFVSTFLLLRKLSNCPLESMTTGGALWFTDLTLPDPYYVLPLIACTTTYVTLSLGLEGGKSADAMPPFMRIFFKLLPVGMFVAIHNFPAAICLYWSSTNFLTLIFSWALMQERVRKLLKIPDKINHDPGDSPLAKMSFMTVFRKMKEKAREVKQSSDDERLNDLASKKAKIDPPRKDNFKPD